MPVVVLWMEFVLLRTTSVLRDKRLAESVTRDAMEGCNDQRKQGMGKLKVQNDHSDRRTEIQNTCLHGGAIGIGPRTPAAGL